MEATKVGGQANRVQGDAPQLGAIVDTASPHLASPESSWVIPVWYLP